MSRFGLIGKNISYSYSKKIHEIIAKHQNNNLSYELFDCESELDVINILNDLRQGSIKGINVTIPYKESIIRYLDELTDVAITIGAVNTVYLQNGRLIGDNTDYYGFLKLLNIYHINPKGQLTYILGSGGAAKSVYYALNLLNAKSVVVSRDTEKIVDQYKLVTGYKTLDIVHKIDILINTTPVGTFPKVDQMPVSISVAHKTNIAIDLIYNPKETLLMKSANFGIGGIIMLIGQAIKAQSVWFNKQMDESKEAFDIILEEVNL